MRPGSRKAHAAHLAFLNPPLPDNAVLISAAACSSVPFSSENRPLAATSNLVHPGASARFDPLKVLEGEEAFVSFILENLPEFPEQYIDIKRVNAGLLKPDAAEAEELELGRNICALA